MNPLIDYKGLPSFDTIQTEHVIPAIEYLLKENKAAIDNLLQTEKNFDWENFVNLLEQIHDRLSRAWAPISHLHGVKNTEDLRKVYQACLPKLTEYYTELNQNEDLYHVYQRLASSTQFQHYSYAQQQSIKNSLRDFCLSGVSLAPEAKKRYQEIIQELSMLQNQFDNNVLDAKNAWQKVITDVSLLQGLPDFALEMFKHLAVDKGVEGYLITLDYPSYSAILTYADNRDLRYECYYAYKTCASELGNPDWDNSDILVKVLELRKEKAKLLGFSNYAEYSLATKMADSPKAVFAFLEELISKAYPKAQQEYQAIKDFAQTELQMDEVKPWDISYIIEKIRKVKFDLSQEQLKPYFPFPKVLQGMFSLFEKLFSISIKENNSINTWHKDVKFYDILDQKGLNRGGFYLDIYARAQKQAGAWMDVALHRIVYDDHIQLPIAYLTCNLTPPTKDKPALLDHEEVLTLLHEFGHGLQHMLTTVDAAGVAGISGIEWDAVELPSQFMEYWAWEKESLDLMAENLPEDLYQKLYDSKNFLSAFYLVRQLEYALFDFKLYTSQESLDAKAINELFTAVHNQVNPVERPDFDRMQHSFGHIFTGGYAAGYYSYLWAEVLSADAFGRFQEQGLLQAEKAGLEFRKTILESGGSKPAMQIFKQFRGREPDPNALLKQLGLLDN